MPSDDRRLRTAFRECRFDDWKFSVNGERMFLMGSNHGPDAHGAGRGDHRRSSCRDVELAVEREPRPAAHPRARHPARAVRRRRRRRPAAVAGPPAAVGLRARRAQAGGPPGPRDGRPARPPPERRPVVRAQRAARDRPANRASDLAPATSREARRRRCSSRRGTRTCSTARSHARARARPTRPARSYPHSGVLPGIGERRHRHAPLLRLVPRRDGRARGRAARRCRASPASSPSSARRPCPTTADFMEPGALARPRLGPTSFEHHALQTRYFDRHVPPADCSTSFDEWRDATQAYQAALDAAAGRGPAPAEARPDRRLLPVLLRRRPPRRHLVGARPRPRARRRGYAALRDACRPVLPMLEPRAGLVHVVSERARRLPGAVVEVDVDGRRDALDRRHPRRRHRLRRRVEVTGRRPSTSRLTLAPPRGRPGAPIATTTVLEWLRIVVRLRPGGRFRSKPPVGDHRCGRGEAGMAQVELSTADQSGGADDADGCRYVGADPEARAGATRCSRFWRSAVGKKWVMAVSGIVLLGYVLVHMIGNLKLFLGASHLNEYAEWLRDARRAVAPAHGRCSGAAHRPHRRVRAPHRRGGAADPDEPAGPAGRRTSRTATTSPPTSRPARCAGPA